MKPENFAYWLQGYIEMTDGNRPTKQQWRMIKEHLQLCFDKRTIGQFRYNDYGESLLPSRPMFDLKGGSTKSNRGGGAC